MIKVALTGGIGSGKSFIARLFEQRGIPVFYADDQAKQLMNTELSIQEQLKSWFGKDIYMESGQLDTRALATGIFKNDEARKLVNELVHHAVYKAFNAWVAAQTAPFALMEAAIIFESGGYKNFDKSILVVAPKALKIKRLLDRGFQSEQEIGDRMNAQWLDEDKIKLADYVIFNDEKESLDFQIARIFDELIAFSLSAGK